jgi:hypothetical protein
LRLRMRQGGCSRTDTLKKGKEVIFMRPIKCEPVPLVSLYEHLTEKWLWRPSSMEHFFDNKRIENFRQVI